MTSPAPDTVGQEDYAFRIDSAPPPIVFGGRLDLTGWLLDLRGKPIHGIRAVVRRRLSGKRIFRARRKRHRLDIASAFPDLPDALASGFLLELRLRLGRNEVTLQVLDHARVWRTFDRATVFAVPLVFLGRLGLTSSRTFFSTYLAQRMAAKALPRRSETSIQRGLGHEGSSPPQTKHVHLFATSKSNLFIIEIGELAAAGFRELGCSAELRIDQLPDENPSPDTLQIVVTPHEYYNLFLSETVRRRRARELTRNLYLLCTEQPETGWFQSNLQWGIYARGLADINALGVRAYRARGLRCHHFHLGYHSILAHPETIPHHERSHDITFIGSMTDRRDRFFADNAEFFAAHQCHLRLVPLGFAKTKETRSYLTTESRNALLSQSRILLNVHYSEQRYFEWHRMLVGLANGCCIITETCEGYGALVPGKHFIMVEPEYLIPCCKYYLAHPDECAAIAAAGSEFVREHFRQAQACRAFLREVEAPLPAERSGAALEFGLPPLAPDAPSHSPAPDLMREFSRQTARLFKQAITADLTRAATRVRQLLPSREPSRGQVPLSESDQRGATIKKREGYRTRWIAQEEAAAAGTPALRLFDNDAFARSTPSQLSIVITLYNYAQFIEGCLESVRHAAEKLSQPPEVIIVNDASSDDSLPRARRVQSRFDLPIRIIDKHFNTGLADARNVGVRYARAPYIFMLDADNLIFPRALEQLLAAITRDGSAAAYSLLCRFRGTPDNRVGLLSYFDWDPQILVQYPYIDAMAMFRRDSLLEGPGYDNRLSQIGWFGWEDYELWLRFAKNNYRVAFVPNILCLYRHHVSSMINTTNLFEDELGRHLVETYPELVTRFSARDRLFGVDRRNLLRRVEEASAAGRESFQGTPDAPSLRGGKARPNPGA